MDSKAMQAAQAQTTLHEKYVEVPDDGYSCTKPYDHLMICHGCGKFHTVRSSFISSPLSIAFKFDDSSTLTIPAHSCGQCPGEAIQNAYFNGMMREAYDRAANELAAHRRPEPQACALCGSKDHPNNVSFNGSHALCVELAKLGKPTPPLQTKYA